MAETLTIEKKNHVLYIGLNRAAKRNAFNMAMIRELSDAYQQLEDDDDLRCGVLFAHGDHFTAGLDLADVSPHFASGDWTGKRGQVDPLGLNGPSVTKPIVSAVQGICFTIGIELFLNTEVRIAANDCRLAMLEVKRGIYPVGGATMRFVREAGWSNAMRWLLTGDEFSADEAYRINLVQEVVEPGKQLERAAELAEAIASRAPLGVRAVMKSARTSVLESEEAAAKELLPLLKPILTSEDAQEGLQSFLERREAKFTGK